VTTDRCDGAGGMAKLCPAARFGRHTLQALKGYSKAKSSGKEELSNE